MTKTTIVLVAVVMCTSSASRAFAQPAPLRGSAENTRTETTVNHGASVFSRNSFPIEISQTSYELKCTGEGEALKCSVDPQVEFTAPQVSLLRGKGVIQLGLCDESAGCRRHLSNVRWDPDHPSSDLAENGLTAPGIFRIVLTINNFPDAAHSNPLTFSLSTAAGRR